MWITSRTGCPLLRNKEIRHKDVHFIYFIEGKNGGKLGIQKVTNKILKNAECVTKSKLATLLKLSKYRRCRLKPSDKKFKNYYHTFRPISGTD